MHHGHLEIYLYSLLSKPDVTASLAQLAERKSHIMSNLEVASSSLAGSISFYLKSLFCLYIFANGLGSLQLKALNVHEQRRHNVIRRDCTVDEAGTHYYLLLVQPSSAKWFPLNQINHYVFFSKPTQLTRVNPCNKRKETSCMSYSDGFSSWTAAIVVNVAASGERWDANNVGKIEIWCYCSIKCHIGYGQHL